MLKPLAIGLLTLTATFSTAAFADNGNSIPPAPQWSAGETAQEFWNAFETWLQEVIADLTGQEGTPSGGGTVAAPEIDPAGAMAALSLLVGGLAVMRGRRSSRKPTV
jgi:4-amino-4-deoxy-L-arabinose transferase-like glycosyltransferase